MKMICVKDKHGTAIETVCGNIEALIAKNGQETTIRMVSGKEIGVNESIEHLKHRIEHQTTALDCDT